MNKLRGFLQIAYIGFAVLFLFKAFELWGTERSRAIIFLVLAGIALFKFFFNKKYTKRFEEHYKKREEEKRNK